VTAFRLSLSCGYYDRTLPVLDGSVKPDGFEFIVGPPRPGFSIGSPDADVYETALLAAIIKRDKGNGSLAIAVFLQRKFFHQLLLTRKDSDITDFADVRGKKVGLLRWYQDALGVWLRRYLKDHYEIAPGEIHWFTDRQSLVPIEESRKVSVTVIPNDKSLVRMLVDGEIDILLHEDAHRFLSQNHGLRRLFRDFKQAEARYFQETAIFPIKHILVIKNSIAEKHPWVTFEILKVFEEAKRIALALLDKDNSFISSPWLHPALEKQSGLSGRDLYPYGIESNRQPLETLVRYLNDQGLISRDIPREEIFARETP
jgi:4,5-dihydroxyphthalate decarboxylase